MKNLTPHTQSLSEQSLSKQWMSVNRNLNNSKSAAHLKIIYVFRYVFENLPSKLFLNVY